MGLAMVGVGTQAEGTHQHIESLAIEGRAYRCASRNMQKGTFASDATSRRATYLPPTLS